MASGEDPGADERQKLGAFLRARRGHLDPQVAGLDGAGRRRVPGLRREEVAQLAMISTDYYTRLEQGRIASASESVLDALANALRLNQDERSYLYRLANKGDEPYPWRRDTEVVRPQVRQLLENLRDIPALVLSRFLDVLAWNDLATAVFKDFATVRRQERNFLRMLFLDPGLPRLLRRLGAGGAGGGRLCPRHRATRSSACPLDRRTVAVRRGISNVVGRTPRQLHDGRHQDLHPSTDRAVHARLGDAARRRGRSDLDGHDRTP